MKVVKWFAIDAQGICFLLRNISIKFFVLSEIIKIKKKLNAKVNKISE